MLLVLPVLLMPVFGRYFVGNGAGMNFTLDLSPRGTYRYEWDGCFGQETVSGRFRVEGNRALLSPPSDKALSVVVPPKTLEVIRWSPRTFLVEPSRLAEFCARFRNGWRGADRWHEGRFLRDGSYPAGDQRASRLKGFPSVPAPYASFVSKPLTAKVVRNIEGYVKRTQITTDGGRVTETWRGFVANLGSEDGIFSQAEVQAPNGQHAVVVKIARHTSTCAWTRCNKPRIVREGMNVSILSTDPPSKIPSGTGLKLVFD